MKKSVDYSIFFAVIALIIFWMIMISSVSIWWSHRVTSSMAESWLITQPYNYFYVLRNIIHVIISLWIIWFLVKIPFIFFEKNAKYIFWISIILLVVVLIIGQSYKGATGWLSIPGIPFNVQPTEFLKFSIIIFLAAYFKENKKYLQDFHRWFLPFAWILAVVLLLVGAQPDFGTILVVIPVAFMMFFIAWANIKHLLLLLIAGILFALSIYSLGKYDPVTGKNENTLWYITQRIDNFFADNEQAINNKTINYQTEQALIAIGSGWFTWLGFWASIQKFWYLPEVQWDFIFSVIVEELWFLWTLVLLGIYMYIWLRWIYISRHSSDLFAKYAAFWITSWITLQAFINIWVNLNIIPLTWITLPFISYWGSSLLSLSLWLALLLSISREIDINKGEKVYYRIWYKHRSQLRKRLWI
jgi:cell division protein FtsW